MKSPANPSTKAKKSTGRSFFNKSTGKDAFFSGDDHRSSPFFPVQPRLTIGETDDPYEREADAVADKIINLPGTDPDIPVVPVRRQQEQAELAQAKPLVDTITPLVQTARKEEENIQEKPIFESPGVLERNSANLEETPVQRREEEKLAQLKSDQNNTGTSTIESGLSASRGRGRPMEKNNRQQMESGFGADFSQVRVHTDSQAVQMNRQLGAQAFTSGNDMYFNDGKYNPGTREGDHLLAHELTHTVQQGVGLQRKIIQRNGDEGNNDEVEPREVSEITAHPKGRIDRRTGGFEMTLMDFPVKRNFSTVGPLQPPFVVPQPGTRGRGRHNTLWRSNVRQTVRERLTSIIGSGFNRSSRYMLSLAENPDVSVVGNINQLTNELLVPFFNQDGIATTFQIEHVLDWQIAGNRVDEFENLILLEASVNQNLGGAVSRLRSEKIGEILDHYNDERADGIPSRTDQALGDTSFRIVVQNVDPSLDFLGSIITGNTMLGSMRNPISAQHLSIREFQLPANHFLLTTSGGGAGYVLPYDAQEYEAGSFKVTVHVNAETNSIQRISIVPILDDGNMTTSGETTDYAAEQTNTNTYRVPDLRQRLRNFFQLRRLSPIELEEPEIGSGFNLSARGRVAPTIPLLRDANIEIEINGREFSVFKEFNSGEIDVPSPFSIENTSLTLGVSSGSGLFVQGRMNFGINEVGSGYIGASASTSEGFELEGCFNFDSNLFDPASIEVAYRDDAWSIGGEIGIPEGKIRGIQSATIEATYSENNFTATGNAELDVPGVDRGTLTVEYGEDGFSIGGSFNLNNDIPGITGGRVEATVSKESGSEDYGLSITGSVQPDIPGINSSLTVAYENGAITISGSADYSRGLLSGEISVGVTNRTISEDGEPTGEPDDEMRVYGSGSLTLQITPWLEATAGVRFLPNGEIEIMGRIGLPSSVDVFDRMEYQRNLFSIPQIEIPIFAIPLGPKSLGLVATINGGLDFEAGIGPGQIERLSAEITYNPDHPEDTTLRGGGRFVIPADAGLTMRADLGLGLSVAFASLTGGIEIAGTLGLAGEAAASVDVEWSPSSGLEMHALGEINVSPQFTFDINLLARASLNLPWPLDLSETWRHNLYSFSWGSGIIFGVSFPVDYVEGEDFNISTDDINVTYPELDIPDTATRLARHIKNQVF